MALLDQSRPPARAERWPTAGDEALVRGASMGVEAAFTEIFARYHAPLVRYCRGILLDDDSAQDAAQNALTNAFRALRGGSSTPHALGPWLYRIAQREAFSLSRRRRADTAARQLTTTDGEDALLSVAAPSDERVRDRLRELVGDLARLPLRQRSALLLRELSGLAYADIALALETTPAAARQSVLEARHALGEAGDGRRQSCAEVRALVDAGDRRRLRGRRVGAHLADCPSCRLFAARIEDRRRDLALLFPLAPAALASGGGGLLAAVTGGGAAAGGAAAGGVAAGGSWSLGLGVSGAAKCALACTAALVGVGAIGAQVAVHPPARRAPVRTVAQTPPPAVPEASPTPAPSVHHQRAGRPASGAPGVRVRRVREASPRPLDRAVRRTASRVTAPGGDGGGGHLPTAAPSAAPATPTAAATPTPTPAPAAVPVTLSTPAEATTTSSPPPGRPPALVATLQHHVQAAIAHATAQAGAPVAAVQHAVRQATEQSGAVAHQAIALAQRVTTSVLGGVRATLQRLLPSSARP